jgi:peptidoglycan/LPS O-acetylase OafA/YrhL
MADKKFIPALTGIRAVCVSFIFFYHLNFFSETSNPKSFLLLNQFYTFLTFFFVLSGFVICHKYYEIKSLQKTKLYNYLVNRVSRVFPILFILITLTFLLQYKDGLYNAVNAIKVYLLNVTLLKGFSSTYHLTGIGPSWSMSVEELFYLLSPLIFLYTTGKKSLLKFVLLFYGIGILLTYIFIQLPIGGFFSSYTFTAYATFFGRVFEFACGIYLARIYKNEYTSALLKKCGHLSLYIGISIVAAAVYTQYLVALHTNVKTANENWLGLFANNIIMPVGIVFIFYSLLYHDSWANRFLSLKPIVAMGNATYSFYLLHTSFVISYIFKFISTNIFIAYCCMLVVAYIFHKLVEQPLAVFLRRKFTISEKN